MYGPPPDQVGNSPAPFICTCSQTTQIPASELCSVNPGSRHCSSQLLWPTMQLSMQLRVPWAEEVTLSPQTILGNKASHINHDVTSD